ncbi:hypothetical protein LTR67_006934 [Exophiala xenobiotica]
MPRHIYTSLDEAANEIRLVTIFPGLRDSDIVIGLHNIHLGQKQNEPTPPFEALSYTWGSVQDAVEIQVGSTDTSDNVLSITKNLHIALQHLRLPDRPRVLWIDSVCVDQDNLQERGHQVRRMADIYTRAKRVVVWLGPEGLHTASAMKTLVTLTSNIQADWSLWITRPANGISVSEHHWADPKSSLPYDEDTIDGIKDLYGREWFQRLWVQQEIRLANDDALVLCGHGSMLFKDLRKAALCLFNKTALDSKIQKARLSHIWSMGDLGYTNLPGIISFTRSCQCTDPRDRIFAVLSFLQKYERDLTITPDYQLTAWRENEPITDAIRRLAPPNVTANLHGTEGETPLDAFCSTLNGNLFSRSYIPDDANSPNFEKFRAIVRQILEPQFDIIQLSESDKAELYNAEKYLRARTFFTTDTGTMGLAPLATQVGDQIVALLGGRSAFVLRPLGKGKGKSKTTGHFHMIGESYIHGFMYGEALLGPFPSQVRSIARYDSRTDAYWRCYLDIDSGVCEIEDPRLGPLPPGWRRNGHDKDHVISWYVNDATGEGFDKEMRDNGFVDPRLQPDALRTRNVNLRIFDLA